MRRRLFLQALGLGIAAGVARRVGADASCAAGAGAAPPGEPLRDPARPSTRLIDEARARARVSGKRLLVVVAPAREEDRWGRAESVGDLLDRGAPESLYPLAFAEPVVATVAEMRAAGIDASGAPLYVGVDAAGAVTQVAGHRREADALALAVPAPPATAAERARRGGAEQERWRRHAIPGSRWGYSVGCGHHAPAVRGDDDEVSMIGCGMGSLGGPARRFLRLYASAIQRRR